MADEKQIILTKSEKKHIYVIPAETMIIKEGETNLDMYKILEGNVDEGRRKEKKTKVGKRPTY
ncbi:MAG: hypothetical protein K6E68_00465 [Lachnospiraceae bacterium]|nr:hypothetical protein [Lachnospiraceae bacterium]